MRDPWQPEFLRLSALRRDTADTVSFDLEGWSAPGFLPGQFNMLYAFGIGEVPISISGDPGEPGLTHTVRAVGRTTEAICALEPGALLGVRGPYGSCWPLEAAEGGDVLVICGGIGLAPLRPALYHLLRHRGRYGKVALLYGVRTPADGLYGPQLEEWAARGDIQVLRSADRVAGAWSGLVGPVTVLLPAADFEPARTTAMVCGPEIMMRFVVEGLRDRGVPEENLYVSMERNMQCAVGFCGHCQYGPVFVCKDGAVFPWTRVAPLMAVREI